MTLYIGVDIHARQQTVSFLVGELSIAKGFYEFVRA